MTTRDHYQVLNISPSATPEEIKKAFRKLALIYHPDKHTDQAFATAKFAEIREAYLILKDRKKRAAYNYERYRGNPLQAYKPLAQTAEDVLELSMILQKKNLSLDPFRLDLDLLFFQAEDLLSDHNLRMLEHADDPMTGQAFVRNFLRAIRPLPPGPASSLIRSLEKIMAKDELIRAQVNDFMKETTQQYYWNRYKIYLALAAAVLFCFFLYLSVKK